MKAETLLNGLYKIVKDQTETDARKAVAGGLIRWYLRNQMFTGKQKEYIKILINWEAKPKQQRKPRKVAKYFLYAISDGYAIKLGHCNNVDKELAKMAKESTLPPVVAWKRYAGKDIKIADKRLKQLMRWCEPWLEDGYWHKIDVADRVADFKLK